MAADTTTRSAPPEEIRAVPVRHPGRWIAAAVIAVLVAMFVHMLVTNPVFQWRFMGGNMFTPPALRGARATPVMTAPAMLLGGAPRIVVAVLPLPPHPLVSRAARGLLLVFPGL